MYIIKMINYFLQKIVTVYLKLLIVYIYYLYFYFSYNISHLQ